MNKNTLSFHLNKYPLSRPCDLVKLLYQSEFGGGHMITDAEEAVRRINVERKLATNAAYQCEYIGGGISRLYLSECNRFGLSDTTVAGMFVLTANSHKGDRANFLRSLDWLLQLVESGELPFDAAELHENLNDYSAQNYPAVSHSDIYKQAYSPMYRVIDTRFVRLLPIFAAIDGMLKEKERVIIALDGRAASGKSTAAELIASVYSVPVIHADDFFLPPEKRTSERYAETGGNLDYERFEAEVIRGLESGKDFDYRRFDCSECRLTDTVKIPYSRVTVIEGAYCLREQFGSYADVTAFFDIDAETQFERIKERDGDYAETFKSKWIPLEEAYIRESGLEARVDYIIK